MILFLIGEFLVLLIVGAMAWFSAERWERMLKQPRQTTVVPKPTKNAQSEHWSPRWGRTVLFVAAAVIMLAVLDVIVGVVENNVPSFYKIVWLVVSFVSPVLLVAGSKLSWLKATVLVIAISLAELWLFVPGWLATDLNMVIVMPGSVVMLAILFYRFGIRVELVLLGLAALVIFLVVLGIFLGVQPLGISPKVLLASPVPDSLVMPDSFRWSANEIVLLQARDIQEVGLLVVVGFCLSHQHERYRLVWGALLGYAAGFVACVAVVALSGIEQSAMFYLVPSTALGLWLGAKRARVPWRDILRSPSMALS